MKTDTPQTDAAWASWTYAGPGVHANFARKLERERDEARAKLSAVFQWINRNHPDGFIDSLTHLQNLERVSDTHHDRLDRLERERNESRKQHAADVAELNERLAKQQSDMLDTIVELREALSGRTVSCSQCNKSARTIEEMRKVIREVYYDTETYADGAPDATAHDRVCNEVASKLEPFLK